MNLFIAFAMAVIAAYWCLVYVYFLDKRQPSIAEICLLLLISVAVGATSMLVVIMTTQFLLGFAAGCVAGPIIVVGLLLLVGWLFFDGRGI